MELMNQLRWDEPSILVGGQNNDGGQTCEGPLAALIEQVLAMPVPAQRRHMILAGVNLTLLDHAKISQLRCRSDFHA